MNFPKLIEDAVVHHRAGRLLDAEHIYREILRTDPKNFDALHLLGVIAYQSGRHDQAFGMLNEALELNPSSADAHRNLGEAYRMVGKLEEAVAQYEMAVSLKPNYPEAHNNLGITLGTLGRHESAISSFGNAIACDPLFALAHVNLGIAYRERGLLKEAIDAFESAITIDADLGSAHIQLAKTLQACGRDAEALAEYQHGLAIDPDLAEGHLLLGYMLHEQGMIEDSLECFNAAVRLCPEDVGARWASTMSQLALVHEAQDEAETSRGNFSKALHELDVLLDSSRYREGEHAVGMQQPFYLAYHEANNSELLSRYGDLCCRLMQSWQSREGVLWQPPETGGKLRIGLVSGQVRNHSVWHAIVKGWLQHLDRDRFAFHIFHTGLGKDAETSFAESRAAYFACAPKSLREWTKEIVAQRVDVLIYPEIGMDPMTLKLASMRLAPVQVVAWGHPETSGLPTLDYYLSAEDFEPEKAQDNYRERLVPLPHLGCYYEALPVNETTIDLDDLGIDERLPILLCPGVPFKYMPQHDWVLVEIARRLQRCQLVFFNHKRENLSEKLAHRLEAAFESAGLFFHAYGVFLPWLKRDAFYELMRKATVYLDTIGFSGFNTAMQAIECGLPVVTKDGRFMRGRLASGILKRMGMPELVAKSEQDYVDLAVKLASDSSYASRTRRTIEAKRDMLFDDTVPIRALEEFLIRASARADHLQPICLSN